MTSLLGRLLVLFPKSVRREDLFTEAVARLFEKNPRLCLDWLRGAGLISMGNEGSEGEHVLIQTQKWLRAPEGDQSAGRVDILIKVLDSTETDDAATPEIVMIESKIGSKEGRGN